MISFTVRGVPAPKGRPRVVRNPKTGRVTTFTPEKTVSYEGLVGLTARAAGARPLLGPVAVEISFYLPDCRRQDIDNLEKAVLDGLNGIAWMDDAQVCQVDKAKFLDARRPRAEVTIRAAVAPPGRAYPVRERVSASASPARAAGGGRRSRASDPGRW